MPVLNFEHLFEQADKLIAAPLAGSPRQVDLRRAISSAYYGVFHYVLTAAADEFVGVTKRGTRRYTLVYRSIDHRNVRDLCNEAKKQQLIARLQKYAPPNGFGLNIQAFASAFLELQEKRHAADYDPSIRVKTSDAVLATATARSAVQRFERATPLRRKTFLALLSFPTR